jgi:hypothetical protein
MRIMRLNSQQKAVSDVCIKRYYGFRKDILNRIH